MITRLVAGVLIATGLTVVPLPSATAGGPTVSVADMRFTPATLRVGLGTTVTWRFPDEMAHTTTSTQGFWDSGSKSGGQTFRRTFGSAGSYPYRCTIHPTMRGTVRVPVARSGSSAAGWTLRWAASGGDTYDVQVRKGSRRWRTLRHDTSATTAAFHRPGTWSVRARTQAGTRTSAWSPAVKVRTAR
ncbi:plastocyanin/azurin family copper-binding protein [Nocardioides pyridinolyticus]